jgi:Beta protein
MVTATRPSYVPALRMKAGELVGLSDLAPDVAGRVLPRMIVPPLEERDESLQAQLLKTEDSPNIADALAAHWRGRQVLVEATYLIPDLGHATIGRWLPRMFERAQSAGVPAVPLVALSDLTTDCREAYRAACGTGSIRLALAVPAGDLVGRGLLDLLLQHLEAMGLSPSECSIIADFGGLDFANPDVVAPIIGGALELLQEVGIWGQVVFQGTNYPDRNPAEPGSAYRVPRNEWLAWRKAIRFDPATAEHMLFGDYAADCATMAFGKNGVRAIRHYRYATPDVWIVERGTDGCTDATAMRDVSRRIVGSGSFAGRSFSAADEFIFLTAHGEAGPGTPTKWRAVNTTHHITRVVADIGGVRGFTLRQRAANGPLPSQGSLFAAP